MLSLDNFQYIHTIMVTWISISGQIASDISVPNQGQHYVNANFISLVATNYNMTPIHLVLFC